MATTSEPSVTDGERGAMASGKGASNIDVENGAVSEAHLLNTTVQSITWRSVTVTVKDRETKQQKIIVDNVEGIVEAGKGFQYHTSACLLTLAKEKYAPSWVLRDAARRHC